MALKNIVWRVGNKRNCLQERGDLMFNREVGNIPKGELGGGGLDKKGVKKTGGGVRTLKKKIVV